MRFGMGARACMFRSALLVGAASLLISPVFAGETITYSYDALGRLVTVVHSGTAPNDGVSANYSYDHADNRTNVAVTTAGSGVTFSVSSNGAVTEGGNSVFTITKAGTAAGSLSVNYAIANGTAVAPGDYTAKSGALTFTTVQSSQTVSVPTVDDTSVEGSETFAMSLSGPTGGAAIGAGTASATISENDVPPPCEGVSFAAANTSATEGANLTYTIVKSGSATGSCSVNYATSNGSAAAGSDYTAKSGTLTFTSTQTSHTVVVATIDDSAVESSETVHLNLSSATGGATISDTLSVGSITDNEPVCGDVSFTVASNGAVTEGGASGFTVSKSGSTPGSCSVNYATANVTAAAGSDYTAKSGTLTFTTAQTSQSVSVATTDDATDENAETFTMSLSGPTSGGSLGTPGSVTATINDNDVALPCNGVSFSVNNPTMVVEGNPLTFTVSKAGATSSSCSISYATANGTAIAGTNYVAKSGTLAFSSAQTSQNVIVTTIDTQRAKNARTMFLNLSNATGGATIPDSQGTGSIDHSGELCIRCLQSVEVPIPSTNTGAPPPDSGDAPPPTPEGE